jgi:hypothetical protein
MAGCDGCLPGHDIAATDTVAMRIPRLVDLTHRTRELVGYIDNGIWLFFIIIAIVVFVFIFLFFKR